MQISTSKPQNIAKRLAARRDAAHQANGRAKIASAKFWRRESFTLPRLAARAKAKALFEQFPKAAYMTEIEFWQELADGRIEFTLRRLHSAD